VRTALFNYLFARARKGAFILRLEDTDRARFGQEYVQNLFDTLDWLGLEWDEGPDKGGPFAPYVQSERFEVYKKYAQELIDKGEAYYCFCDAERLERIRAIQNMNKMPPGYDRNCRRLTAEERAQLIAEGKKPVVRLKVPLEGVTRFTDALLGDIEWKNEDINPDPVLLKSDGFPTYHLANVVDDHLMRISHVMRAQEWVPSTPLHVLLYRAFGWEPPVFCHLPMVMGSDGQKLSKRHGATSVNEFRSKGYVPEALVNYVAMLGASYEEGRDIFPLGDLERLFSIDRLNKAPAVFDYKKLEWFNGQYIRAMTDEELYRAVLPFLGDTAVSGITINQAGEPRAEGQSPEETKAALLSLMPLIKERLHFLSEAPQMAAFLFKTPELPPREEFIPKKLDQAATKAALLAGLDFVKAAGSLSHDEADALARETADKLGVKLGDFMMPLRLALTGSRISPPLIGSIGILGTERAVSRVQKALGLFA
jgi:glutamyl-tRNA synthetase